METKVFDYIISNPPYQDSNKWTSAKNIYPDFIYYSSFITKSCLMIHPGRAFKGASRSDKNIVKSIINDKNTYSIYDNPNGQEVFPTVDIRGGVMISYKTSEINDYPYIDESMPLTLFDIKNKVINSNEFTPITDIIHRVQNTVKYNNKDYILNTNLFELIDYKPISSVDTDSVNILCRINGKREVLSISKDNINKSVPDKWCVFVPSAGGKGVNGVIGQPMIGKPRMISTHTFIVFGYFDSEYEAINCMRYIKSQFCRTLLQVCKITQHNTKNTWRFVPLLDFSDKIIFDNDDLDSYLFEHYLFTNDEIKWVNDNIKIMK